MIGNPLSLYAFDCVLYVYIYSDNEDPMVRAVALRSMCDLKLECILTDISAYVRKAAVMGILKVDIL